MELGVAQAAIQQGRYVGRLICQRLKGREPKRPFRYFDKGNMAVVGKNFAILEAGRFRMSGFMTWLIWALSTWPRFPSCRIDYRSKPNGSGRTSPVSAARE